MNNQRVIGLLCFLIGIFIFLGSLQITGYAIAKNVGVTASSILGLAFIIGGILLFIAGRAEAGLKESPLVALLEQIVPASYKDDAIYLIDASFIEYIHNKDLQYSESTGAERGTWIKDNLQKDFFGNYHFFITGEVYREIASPKNRYKKNLVPGSVVDNFRNRGVNFLISEKYSPSKDTKEKIFGYWKRGTKKGRRADKEQEKIFYNSGDMEMLCKAAERGRKMTGIITNDVEEIGEIASRLREYDQINAQVIPANKIFKEDEF